MSYTGGLRPPSPSPRRPPPGAMGLAQQERGGGGGEQRVPLPLPTAGSSSHAKPLTGSWARPLVEEGSQEAGKEYALGGYTGRGVEEEKGGDGAYHVVDDDEAHAERAREGMGRHMQDRAQATWPVLPPGPKENPPGGGGEARVSTVGSKPPAGAGGGLNSEVPKMNPLAKSFDIIDTKAWKSVPGKRRGGEVSGENQKILCLTPTLSLTLMGGTWRGRGDSGSRE